MFENLVVSTWIGVRAGCEMTYCINTEDIDHMLSDGARRFEFAIETEALRTLLDLGSKALAELDAIAIEEGAKQAAQERASQEQTGCSSVTSIPPPDDAAHLDNLLMAEVTSLDAAVADGLRARAARREQDGEPLRLFALAMSEAADG